MADEAKEKLKQKLIQKFSQLHRNATKRGLSHTVIKGILNDTVLKEKDNTRTTNRRKDKQNILWKSIDKWNKRWVINASIVVVILCLLVTQLRNEETRNDIRNFIFYESRCALSMNGFAMEIVRPLTKCEQCRNLTEVPIERNISTEVFIQKYAYSIVPVLVKEATRNWTAMTTFSFQYLKKLYTETEGALAAVEEECQFFPYKTEFETLADAFNISDDRANFVPGEKPWYIGWSNCDKRVSAQLRKHYQRPYFLPADSESSTLDWIFMGGSGLGAFIHLDYVSRPSWQAQISGRKTWTIIPVPECEAQCHSMNVTVDRGDILVIDTNQWYHSTTVQPGEISICIGSEFD